MRNYLIVSLLVSTFFSGCEVSFKSRVDRLQDQKVMASASACHDEEAIAKTLAVEALSKSVSTSSITEESNLKRIKGDKVFCYEAVITYKIWSKYILGLQKQRESIALRIDEHNNTVLYNKKAAVVEELQKEITAFNAELIKADSIGPNKVSAFDLDQQMLNTSINAVPSVKVTVRSCKGKSNYRCLVGFISEVNDESKEITYHWEFGDGATSNRKNPLHTYHEAGEYIAILHLQDIHDVNNTVKTEINVEISAKPVAKFAIKEGAHYTQASVLFNNTSYSHKNRIASSKWDFGDGKKSSKQNPKHKYKRAGDYLVQLKVCNDENLCSIASKNIYISQNKVLIGAKEGVLIEDYIAENGEPSEQIVKKRSLMSAYKYGNIWLLAKRGKIKCAVQDKGLYKNLMGQPKKCYWHAKHAKQYIIELK
ncbi:MAG: PKD domain-containing protein [Helicobacteraceae bacterium]|nr:PKD domain-containing protein [Helicobacteraceae bacterium]